MDSTLRDGEQTNGVSFLPHEKQVMARKLLQNLNVDRIEVASARVSEGEKESVTAICRFADSHLSLCCFDRSSGPCRGAGLCGWRKVYRLDKRVWW